MLSLSDKNQTDIIEAFNSTSRYLDDLHNFDNPYFEQMVDQIYPTELQLNKANSSTTEAPDARFYPILPSKGFFREMDSQLLFLFSILSFKELKFFSDPLSLFACLALKYLSGNKLKPKFYLARFACSESNIILVFYSVLFLSL